MKSRSHKAPAFLKPAWGALLSIAVFFVLCYLQVRFCRLEGILGYLWYKPVLWAFPLCISLAVYVLVSMKQTWKQVVLFMICFALSVVTGAFVIGKPEMLTKAAWLARRTEAMETDPWTDEFDNTTLLFDLPVPLYLENGLESTGMDYESISAYLETLPEELVHRAGAFFILSEETFKEQMDDSYTSGTYGYTTVDTQSIILRSPGSNGRELYTINKDGTLVSLSSADFFNETIVHELCHLLDYRLEGDALFTSRTDVWKQLYQEYAQDLSEYSRKSSQEFFAETGVYYFLYPDLLKQISPELYDAFDQVYLLAIEENEKIPAWNDNEAN